MADRVTPAQLLEQQRAHIDKAQGQIAARQRRLARAALVDLDRGLGRLRPGSWGEASHRAAMVMLGQAMRTLVGRQVGDLGAGLSEVTKMSARDAAKLLTTLDEHYLGSVRPLRFDTAAWWEATDKRIGQVRLREFARSFQRYGGQAVADIEDELGKRILTGESWDKARAKVWESTRDVVGDRQWMVDRIVRTEVHAAYNGTTLAALHEENDMADPMLKRLVATFDHRTGQDSVFVHGQTKPLAEKFEDNMGRRYDAPPNRPHDREIVVGWRKSYGQDMPDFVEETAAPGDAGAPEFDPGPKMEPKEPVHEPEIVPMRPAARLSQLEVQRAQVRAAKAVAGNEIKQVMRSQIPAKLIQGAGPESIAVADAHNAAVQARVDAIRGEIRDLQVAQAQIDRELRRAKKAERAKKAVGVDVAPPPVPPPKSIARLEGPAKPPPPGTPPPPTPTASADIDARERGIPRALHSGVQIGDATPVGELAGVNESKWVTLRDDDGDEVVAIFKPSAGEQEGLRRGIEAGSYHRREAFAYDLDAMLGGETVVPPTVTRTVGQAGKRGREGSVQLRLEGAHNPRREEKGAKLYRRHGELNKLASNVDARRMDTLDLLLANTDRHAGNLLVREVDGKLRAVAIDNGLTMPTEASGSIMYRWPWGGYMGDPLVEGILRRWSKLSPALHKQVQSLDLTTVARTMQDRGIEQAAARACLVRIKAMQNNPQVIADIVQTTYMPQGEAREHFVKQSIKDPTALISTTDLAEIDRVLDGYATK